MRSPFTGLRAALMEIKNFRSSGWLMFSICAIALIPLVYAGLFLLAFLDPYGNLVNVPAAVVNLDEGAELDGEKINVGQMLCDKLIENNEDRSEGQASGYDWHFVQTVEQADRGLEDATYYMEIVIPKDFSENIASASGDNPAPAELQVYLNPSTNLIATTVGQSMVTKIKSELNTTLDETFFDNIFISISDVGDGLGEAADGAGELASGLGSAADGVGQIGSGAGQLADGSAQLTDGAQQLGQGSSTLTDGLEGAAAGAGQLDAGLGQLADGLQQLQDGIAAGDGSSASLAQALSGVASALEAGDFSSALQYAGAVRQANPTIGNDLYTYVSSLASAAAGYQQAGAQAASAAAAMDEKKTAMEAAGSELSGPQGSLESAAGAFGSDLQGLAGTLQAFQASPDLSSAAAMAQAGASLVSSSTSGSGIELLVALQGFSSALQSYQAAAAEYQAAAADYQAAATAQAEAAAAASEAKGACIGYLMGVKNTSEVASDSTGQLSGALDQLLAAVNGQLRPGTSSLASGIASAAEGSNAITYNLGQLATGSNAVTEGLRKLASGVAALDDGLGQARDGANELAQALNDAADEMADSASNHERRAEVMASPVIANGEFETGETITQVSNYGTGFAPYFIGLGMWVGCLMISFLIRALNNRILMSQSSSASAVLSSYLPMVGIAWIQVIILLLFIQFGLGFSVRFPLWYYLFGLLVACCFTAIVQFFRASMGTSGLVVIVILLMLQLCTAAGTFPIEAELPIFNILNPLLPMTYVVQGFRMAMCGLSTSYMVKPAVVLACFTAAFLFFSTLWAHHCRKASMTTLYPKIQMVG